MLVSHRHEFIFIKTAKTGASSAELFLRQFCGPGDIITPLTYQEEVLAAESKMAPPANYGNGRLRPWELRPRNLRSFAGSLLFRKKWPLRDLHYPHQSATEVRHVIGHEIWERYRKITVVRDPWDTAVSRHYWQMHRKPYLSPSASLGKAVERAGSNWLIYSIDDRVAVDIVLHHEHLGEGLALLARNLGLRPRIDVPKVKAGIRPKGIMPHDILDIQQARRIAELAHHEIRQFGYSWSGPIAI